MISLKRIMLIVVFWFAIGTISAIPTLADQTMPESESSYGDMALYFEENLGQTDAQARYFARVGGYSLFLTPERIAFNLQLDEPAESAESVRSYGLFMDFVGANENPILSGESIQAGISSYFSGQPDEWVTGVSHYESVRYAGLYDGIDAMFYGNPQQIQYDFIVAAGADPSQIRLKFNPVERVSLTDNGDLKLSLGERVLTMNAPYSYQMVDGVQRVVESQFVLDGDEITFALGDYDSTLPLIIDPVLVYAGYLGGSATDAVNAIAVDSSGAAYITGLVDSTESTFPVMGGPDLIANGERDAFVAKIRPDGTGFVYVGYIGGDSSDEGKAIGVDAAGHAYVMGTTASDQTSFPVINGLDMTFNGNSDAFIAKVTPTGTALAYATYLGGADSDMGLAGAVDAAGNVYIGGETRSDQTTFPVTTGPDVTWAGSADGFVAKLNAAGSAWVYAGYIGGASPDGVIGLALDSSGSVYLTGYTNSTEATFPVLIGPDLTYSGVSRDAFITKVSADGTSFVYSGYIGSSNDDFGYGVAVDANGYAYLVISNTWGGLPVLVGPDLTYNDAGNPGDAYVAKVKSDGTSLAYAGYIGGSSGEGGYAIAVDPVGNAYVVGSTSSTQSSFPVVIGPDLTHNGGPDVFLAKINPMGSALTYAGYIGGTGGDSGLAVALDADFNVYIAGSVFNQVDNSFPTLIGPDLTYTLDDAFVLKFSPPPNLIQNAGFETANSAQLSGADRWGSTNLTSDKRNCAGANKRSGSCAFLFKGSATEKAVITQNVSAPAAYRAIGSKLTFGVWAKTTTTPSHVLGKVTISYTDSTKDSFSLSITPSVDLAYRYYEALPFTVLKPIKKITVSFRNYGVAGTVTILDDVRLISDSPAVASGLPSALPFPLAPESPVFRSIGE